ncbi:TetR family transcriptional regulator [Pseudarthrobacter sp. MDT3-28]|uniref:TetR/AcrR family transcriptional regulator n=1 Tax=Pseudarthrobacter raffinosi TaxID=2953651 RepID=UPI00208F89E8|nr:TetR family transcriptional regulator [Pseudarthrobacter sp. MDT3-28]MCO4239399.1 TetR family transcriptional regulator [Pseudarthrobacter sp. MDT3-28]
MAWNTDATRARLLDAAISEFSERGFSGGRVHQIARKSGCNAERIYFYFGNKATLFEAALTHQLVTALDDLSIVGSGPSAVADFAGRYFDFATGHPGLARLTSWEGLERGHPVGAEGRALHSSNKVSEIRAALPAISEAGAEDLLLTIVTLCHAWISTPNVHLVITGEPDEERRRAAIMRASELLAFDAGTD